MSAHETELNRLERCPMDDNAGLVADFYAAAVVAKVDGDVLLGRLATRLSGIVVPPRTDNPREPGSQRREGIRELSRRRAVPWGRGPLATLTLEEAVAGLQSDERLVRMLLKFGSLQGVDIDGCLHIPEWQFDAESPTGLLRGLGMILTAAEGRLDWRELAIFMVTPQPALLGEGARSIVEWLHDDRPLQPVLDIVRSNREPN